MATYTFYLRPITTVRGMWEYSGNEDARTGRLRKEDPIDGAIIETDQRRFAIFNDRVTVDDLDGTVEITLDLPSLETAEAIATAINDGHLDPWAVDLVMGPTEDGSEDVIWEA